MVKNDFQFRARKKQPNKNKKTQYEFEKKSPQFSHHVNRNYSFQLRAKMGANDARS